MRVVRGPEGSLVLGRTLPGRGAWLCAGSLACVHQAARRNALAGRCERPCHPTAVVALGPTLTG